MPDDPIDIFTRKTADGKTTVMFYAFGQTGIKADGSRDETHVEVDALTRSYIESAYREAEQICAIRCFNLDRLTEEDSTYLKAQQVAIPATADVVAHVKERAGVMNGKGGFPRKNDNEPSAPLLIGSHLTDPADSAYNPDKLKLVILHEVLHTLGPRDLKNRFSAQYSSDCTVLAYNDYSRFQSTDVARALNPHFYPTHYQELDIESLQQCYGPSGKALEWLRQIHNEEMKANQAKAWPLEKQEGLQKLVEGLTQFIREKHPSRIDGATLPARSFNPQALKQLSDETEAYIKTYFSSEIAFIREKYPNFGMLVVHDWKTEGDDSISIDFSATELERKTYRRVGNISGFAWQEHGGSEFKNGISVIDKNVKDILR